MNEVSEQSLEPRIWGWSAGRLRQPLASLIDREDAFVFRPYISSHFTGVEGLHIIYHDAHQESRNDRHAMRDGVYDFWSIRATPGVIPSYIITYHYGPTGGMFCPAVYRPDRGCRQFGLDQAPSDIGWPFVSVTKAMQRVLFTDTMLPFDRHNLIPLARLGGVYREYLAYHHTLKVSLRNFEAVRSNASPPRLDILKEDPYFMTSTCANAKRLRTVPSFLFFLSFLSLFL